MFFLPHVPAPIGDLAANVKAAVGGFVRRAAEQAAKLRGWVRLVVDKLMERLPPEKRRMVLIVSFGAIAVCVLLFAGTSLLARGSEGRKPPAAERAPAGQGLIPVDDLFLPGEPDFIPGVLPEREQRTVWTADDAAPLWQDPLKNGEEPWRNRIEKAIDEIMESVP